MADLDESASLVCRCGNHYAGHPWKPGDTCPDERVFLADMDESAAPVPCPFCGVADDHDVCEPVLDETRAALSDSGRRVMRLLRGGPLDFRTLFVRMRPMDEAALTQVVYALDRAGYITFLDDQAVLTVTGLEATR